MGFGDVKSPTIGTSIPTPVHYGANLRIVVKSEYVIWMNMNLGRIESEDCLVREKCTDGF